MKMHLRWLLVIITVCLLTAQACLLSNLFARESEPTALSPTETSRPQVVPTATLTARPATEEAQAQEEIVLGEQAVVVWAEGASASSSAGDPGYGAVQVVGTPDTVACGDFVTAWQPGQSVEEAWLEVTLPAAILPEEIYITHSYLPGQIGRVEVVTLEGDTISVYDADQAEPWGETRDCPLTRVLWLAPMEDMIDRVRVSLTRNVDEPWTQIDAVGVFGRVSEDLTAHYLPQPVEIGADEEDFYAPKVFANHNRINAVLFAENTLWTASDGGIVAWDLVNGAPAYQVIENYPTYAMAYCRWEWPRLMVADAAGIGWLDPAMLPYEPFVERIDHPGDDDLGKISALGCDHWNQQLWVGYSGHLSRYDVFTQTWTEFSWRDGMPQDTVRQITVIGDEVWAATAAGVAVVRAGDRLETYAPENSQIPTQFIHGIASDEGGVIWMASSSGLLSFEEGAWRSWDMAEIDGGAMTNMLAGLKGAEDGTLWIADFAGTMCNFEPGSRTCRQVIEPPQGLSYFEDFHMDPDDRLAVGSLSDGLWAYEQGEWQTLATADQPSENSWLSVAQTPDGHLWLAGTNTLQYFDPRRPLMGWEVFPLPPNAAPRALLAANDGLWIGHTRGATFLPYLPQENRFDLLFDTLDTGAPTDSVSAISRDGDGRVYFGLYGGLLIWQDASFRYVDLLSETERANNTYPPRVNVLYTNGDEVWAGASNGLYHFVAGEMQDSWSEELAQLPNSMSSSVGVIAPSPDGCGLLIGVGSCLYCFDGSQFALLTELPSEITSLYADIYTVWVATASDGIFSTFIDSSGVYWDAFSSAGGYASRYGYQAILMSDLHTVWFASLDAGLLRRTGLFGQ